MSDNFLGSISDRKILVTGATGFIGAHLVAHLLNSGCQLRLLIRKKNKDRFCAIQNIEICLGDVRHRESLVTACEGIDVVVHLAGAAHTNNPLSNDINFLGSKSLLSAAVEQKVSRFVLISSSLASQQSLQNNQASTYGKSKFDAENVLLDAHSAGDIEGVILRPVNVYGVGMGGSIAALISLVKRGLVPPLPQFDTRISLVGVDDVSQAITLAIGLKKASGNTYLITDGHQYLVSDIEREIYRALDRKMPNWRMPHLLLYVGVYIIGFLTSIFGMIGIRIPFFSGLSSRTYENLANDNLFDNSKACGELGYEPTGNFFSSLSEILINDKA